MAGLEASYQRFGLVQPIVWNQRTGYVVGGHQRLKILKKQRVKQTEVVVVDLDDTEERALNVALNNPHISGEFTADLQSLLEGIQSENDLLFHSLRLDELLGEPIALPPTGDPEAVPDPPAEAKTKPGDVYVLGNHRLICGDSTQAGTFEALLGNERVDLLLTDPPYGSNYSAKTYDMNVALGNAPVRHRDIANDTYTNLRQFFASWLSIIPWNDPNAFFIFLSGHELHNLRLAIEDCGLKWSDYLIWVKDVLVLGRKDYNLRHEFIVYGWNERHRFYGPTNSVSVFEFNRSHKSKLHPTMKPIDLLERLLTDGSAPSAIVLDPFGGSGSTLIACEAQNRQARLVELDPLYCDVIVKRWEEFTGKTATLQA